MNTINVLLVAKLHQTVKMPAQIEQGIKNEMIFIAQALLKFIYHVLTFSHIHRIILQKKKLFPLTLSCHYY